MPDLRFLFPFGCADRKATIAEEKAREFPERTISPQPKSVSEDAGALLGFVIQTLDLAKSRRKNRAGKFLARKNQTVQQSKGKTHHGRRSYDRLIRRYARANGVPYALARAVVQVESGFRASARGGVGEIGLMQLRKSTARGMGYRGSTRALYNPETNIKYGMRYLG